MPTFTAIALESLLEPGASKSVDLSVPSKSFQNSRPPRLVRKKLTEGRKIPQRSPVLCAPPEAISAPDSPLSFPTSSYIMRRNGRGPCIPKSFSESDASGHQETINEGNGYKNSENSDAICMELKTASTALFIPGQIEEECASSVHNLPTEMHVNVGLQHPNVVGQMSCISVVRSRNSSGELDSGLRGCKINDAGDGLSRVNKLQKLVSETSQKNNNSKDFYDLCESLSCTSSSEVDDDAGAEISINSATSAGEFYDACEDFSTDSGLHASVPNIESEFCEIRLSLLTEIERRKEAEDALNHMQSCWQKIRQQLFYVGLSLPRDPIVEAEDEQSYINLEEQLKCHFDVARDVSDCVGRAIARAELEREMEAQIQSKNFEISRLTGRVHYYETVNREMSQRNQRVVVMTRRSRQGRKRNQRWVWACIAGAIVLGSSALMRSYIPLGRSSCSDSSRGSGA